MRAPAENDHQPDGEAIQTIGDVHGITGAHYHENEKEIERQKGQRPGEGILHEPMNQQVRSELLQERHVESCGVLIMPLHPCQGHRQNCRHQHLQGELSFCAETQIAVLRELRPIVNETDGAKCQQRKHRQPRIRLLQVSPNQCWHDNTDDDQNAAHSRRPGFFQM